MERGRTRPVSKGLDDNMTRTLSKLPNLVKNIFEIAVVDMKQGIYLQIYCMTYFLYSMLKFTSDCELWLH